MNKKVISFSRKKLPNTGELRRLYDEGYTIICLICRAKLFLNPTEIGCSRNTNHFHSIAHKGLSPYYYLELYEKDKLK